MSVDECLKRGQRLVAAMQMCWLQRRQRAIEPTLRRNLGLEGKGKTTERAEATALERLQKSREASDTFERYMTDVESVIGGPRYVTSRLTQRGQMWELPKSASFENSFVKAEPTSRAETPSVNIVADKNFNYYAIGLANSEVLYLQYQSAGFTERANMLKRQFIMNDETKLVTAESFRRARVNPDTSSRRVVHTYETRDPMFYALLGTPNGRAAAYLVIDHGADLGIIGVDRIEHDKEDGKENMYLFFTSDTSR